MMKSSWQTLASLEERRASGESSRTLGQQRQEMSGQVQGICAVLFDVVLIFGAVVLMRLGEVTQY